MSRADQTADALEGLMQQRGDPILAEVLGTALDQYELTRLWLVATERLGRSPIRHFGGHRRVPATTGYPERLAFHAGVDSSPPQPAMRIDPQRCVVCATAEGHLIPLAGGGLICTDCAGVALEQ